MNADRRSDLERAYQLTRYEVPALGLVLTIGQTSPVLDQLLCEQGVKAWSFISAANPHSRLASAAINARQHQRLIQRVQTLGVPFFEGVGVAVEGGWPAEPSLLILGIKRSYAVSLGREFEQNAIVAAALGEVAALIWC